MRTALALVGALLTAGVATVSVQPQPPDLSGTWVATKDTPATVGLAPSAVFGERFAFRADGKAMQLSRPVRGRGAAVTSVIPLDGSEVTLMNPSRTCLGQPGQVVSVAWEGGALRYSIVGSLAAGAAAPTRSAAPLNYHFRPVSADTLVVETSIRDSATAAPRAVGTVYRRSAEALPADAPPVAPVAPARIGQVAWISGTWINATGANRVEEQWSAANGGAMLATSRTLRGDVMTEFEFLCISERDGTLVYTALPNANAPTDFTLTTLDADSATFENPAHDFPKMIRYARRADGGLDATISGGPTSKPTTFSFTRKQ